MKYRIKQVGKYYYAQKRRYFFSSWDNIPNWEFIRKYDLKAHLLCDCYNEFLTYDDALKAIEEDKLNSIVKIHNL